MQNKVGKVLDWGGGGIAEQMKQLLELCPYFYCIPISVIVPKVGCFTFLCLQKGSYCLQLCDPSELFVPIVGGIYTEFCQDC